MYLSNYHLLAYMWYDEIFLDVQKILCADHFHVVELGTDLLFHDFEESANRSSLTHLHHLVYYYAFRGGLYCCYTTVGDMIGQNRIMTQGG